MIASMFGKITFVGKKKLIFEVNWKSYWFNIKDNHDFEASDKPRRIFCRQITYINNNEIKTDMYGFASPKELEWFNSLLTCNKVGPKTAMKIMNHDISMLQQLIIEQNISKIANLKGLNKTLATSLVANDWSPWDLNYEISQDGGKLNQGDKQIMTDEVEDTLKVLGYSDEAINFALKDIAFDQNKDISDIISDAIKIIANASERNANETKNI